jgi:peptidase M28-like protein
MRRAGLQRVRAVPVRGRKELINVEGVLPGEIAEEIVVSAHYDSVPASPGAGDDSSGCGVAVAAAAELRRTPLRHTVRIVLFDGEETGLHGSRGWLADLGPEGRRRILAGLNLEMVGWNGSAGPVILSFPARTAGTGERTLAPGWLVHAVLRSGETVDWPFAVADNRFPLLAQLMVRSAEVLYGSDSESFLEQGVPSVTLSDSSMLVLDPAYHRSTDVAARLDARRLDGWTQAAAAAVRRLDALAGRPLPEDQYLVAFGRVWLRRDLLWAGFLLWTLLVFRGRPGRRRGGSAADHGRQMRAYLPGFLFRVLLLLAIFFAPVFSVLLLPAAVLALIPPRPVWARLIWIAAGILPLLCFLLALGIATAAEIVRPDPDATAAALVPLTLAAYALTIARGPSGKPGAESALTVDDAPGKVES